MSLPQSWSEVYERLTVLLGSRHDAEEWVREALEKSWGVLDPHDLERGRRSIALQRVSGVVLALEEEPGDIAFAVEIRQLAGAVFGRYFNVTMEGPPWRLSPYEDKPTRTEWVRSADFEEVLQ